MSQVEKIIKKKNDKEEIKSVMRAESKELYMVDDYTFVPAPTNVSKNHDEWTFEKMNRDFGTTVNDKPVYQRPDVDGSALLMGEGNNWQKQLMRDVIQGNPFQPIHLRLKDSVWEIVDGGHRTRSVVKFLKGYVRLPKDTIITDVNGKEFDLSEMTFKDILRKHPMLAEYIWNLKFEVYEYTNLSDKQATKLFIKLNNLNKMSPADKRNAVHGIIADVCRDRGAVDGRTSLDIFTITEKKSGKETLRYVSLPRNRTTDEIVSYALYYLYKGGIFNDDFVSFESQTELNNMYEDETLKDKLGNSTDTLLSDLDSLLKVVNDVIILGKFSSARSANWGKGAIKKLIMLICESAWNAGGFKKYKPDVKKLHNELSESFKELCKSKVKHKPHRLYEVKDNKVVALPKSKQPEKVNYNEEYKFSGVFSGGGRVDDLQYIYYHFLTKGFLGFGLKTTTKDNSRSFTEKQKEELYIIQNGKCAVTGQDLDSIEYVADHILPYAYGGPTEVKNGQLICKDANEMKSSGMTISEVELLCNRYDCHTEKIKALIEYTKLFGDDRLDGETIKKVKELVIG